MLTRTTNFRLHRTLAAMVLVLLALLTLAGCGQRYIQVDLFRSQDLGRPVWIGVYFLSQESALDHLSNQVLATEDGVSLGAGVVHKDVFPLKPGVEPRRIELPEYNTEIRWIEIVAGFPDAEPCARRRVAVKENAKLNLAVTVDDHCVELVTE